MIDPSDRVVYFSHDGKTVEGYASPGTLIMSTFTNRSTQAFSYIVIDEEAIDDEREQTRFIMMHTTDAKGELVKMGMPGIVVAQVRDIPDDNTPALCIVFPHTIGWTWSNDVEKPRVIAEYTRDWLN